MVAHVATFQIFTVRSIDPEASIDPSGEKSSDVT